MQLWEQLGKCVQSFTCASGVGPGVTVSAGLAGTRCGKVRTNMSRRTNWNLCLALTAFILRDTGDLQKKLALCCGAALGTGLRTAAGGQPHGGSWRGHTTSKVSLRVSDSMGHSRSIWHGFTVAFQIPGHFPCGQS